MLASPPSTLQATVDPDAPVDPLLAVQCRATCRRPRGGWLGGSGPDDLLLIPRAGRSARAHDHRHTHRRQPESLRQRRCDGLAPPETWSCCSRPTDCLASPPHRRDARVDGAACDDASRDDVGFPWRRRADVQAGALPARAADRRLRQDGERVQARALDDGHGCSSECRRGQALLLAGGRLPLLQRDGPARPRRRHHGDAAHRRPRPLRLRLGGEAGLDQPRVCCRAVVVLECRGLAVRARADRCG